MNRLSDSVIIAHDYLCPWCWIGFFQAKRLKAEFPQIKQEWRGFELLPEELGPVPEYKPRPKDPSRPPSQLEILADLDGIPIPENRTIGVVRTHDALQGAEYAKDVAPDLFDAYNEEVYRAFWERSEDISNHDVLGAIALKSGLDRAEIPGADRREGLFEEDCRVRRRRLRGGHHPCADVCISRRTVRGSALFYDPRHGGEIFAWYQEYLHRKFATALAASLAFAVVAQPSMRAQSLIAQVRVLDGVPRLLVNGEPIEPRVFWGCPAYWPLKVSQGERHLSFEFSRPMTSLRLRPCISASRIKPARSWLSACIWLTCLQIRMLSPTRTWAILAPLRAAGRCPARTAMAQSRPFRKSRRAPPARAAFSFRCAIPVRANPGRISVSFKRREPRSTPSIATASTL